jgi:hypothetical protein
MSNVKWVEPVVVARSTAGPTLTAAATASCIPTDCAYSFPAQTFDFVGKRFRVEIGGKITTAVTTPGTIKFGVYLGGTLVWDGVAISAVDTAGFSNVPWRLSVELTAQAVGTTATFLGTGVLTSAVLTKGAEALPYRTAPAAGSSVDATAALALDVKYTPSLTTTSLTVLEYAAFLIN